MSYFTAVIAGNAQRWRARDVEIEDASTLDDLADTLRAARSPGGTVLAVIEHEDEWFALVRVDGDEEPRVFVSDMFAASRSAYGDVLAPAADVDVHLDDEDDDDPGDQDDDDDTPSGEDDEPAVSDDEVMLAWAGEPDLLEDLGLDGRRLRMLAEEQGDDPAGVLAEIAEECGFGELLDALR